MASNKKAAKVDEGVATVEDGGVAELKYEENGTGSTTYINVQDSLDGLAPADAEPSVTTDKYEKKKKKRRHDDSSAADDSKDEDKDKKAKKKRDKSKKKKKSDKQAEKPLQLKKLEIIPPPFEYIEPAVYFENLAKQKEDAGGDKSCDDEEVCPLPTAFFEHMKKKEQTEKDNSTPGEESKYAPVATPPRKCKDCWPPCALRSAITGKYGGMTDGVDNSEAIAAREKLDSILCDESMDKKTRVKLACKFLQEAMGVDDICDVDNAPVTPAPSRAEEEPYIPMQPKKAVPRAKPIIYEEPIASAKRPHSLILGKVKKTKNSPSEKMDGELVKNKDLNIREISPKFTSKTRESPSPMEDDAVDVLDSLMGPYRPSDDATNRPYKSRTGQEKTPVIVPDESPTSTSINPKGKKCYKITFQSNKPIRDKANLRENIKRLFESSKTPIEAVLLDGQITNITEVDDPEETCEAISIDIMGDTIQNTNNNPGAGGRGADPHEVSQKLANLQGGSNRKPDHADVGTSTVRQRKATTSTNTTTEGYLDGARNDPKTQHNNGEDPDGAIGEMPQQQLALQPLNKDDINYPNEVSDTRQAGKDYVVRLVDKALDKQINPRDNAKGAGLKSKCIVEFDDKTLKMKCVTHRPGSRTSLGPFDEKSRKKHRKEKLEEEENDQGGAPDPNDSLLVTLVDLASPGTAQEPEQNVQNVQNGWLPPIQTEESNKQQPKKAQDGSGVKEGQHRPSYAGRLPPLTHDGADKKPPAYKANKPTKDKPEKSNRRESLFEDPHVQVMHLPKGIAVYDADEEVSVPRETGVYKLDIERDQPPASENKKIHDTGAGRRISQVIHLPQGVAMYDVDDEEPEAPQDEEYTSSGREKAASKGKKTKHSTRAAPADGDQSPEDYSSRRASAVQVMHLPHGTAAYESEEDLEPPVPSSSIGSVKPKKNNKKKRSSKKQSETLDAKHEEDIHEGRRGSLVIHLPKGITLYDNEKEDGDYPEYNANSGPNKRKVSDAPGTGKNANKQDLLAYQSTAGPSDRRSSQVIHLPKGIALYDDEDADQNKNQDDTIDEGDEDLQNYLKGRPNVRPNIGEPRGQQERPNAAPASRQAARAPRGAGTHEEDEGGGSDVPHDGNYNESSAVRRTKVKHLSYPTDSTWPYVSDVGDRETSKDQKSLGVSPVLSTYEFEEDSNVALDLSLPPDGMPDSPETSTPRNPFSTRSKNFGDKDEPNSSSGVQPPATKRNVGNQEAIELTGSLTLTVQGPENTDPITVQAKFDMPDSSQKEDVSK